MATSVAMVSATNGSPKKLSMERAGAMASTTPATDFRMMSTSGMRMMSTTVEKLGSLEASTSACWAICSGTGIWYFLPQ